MGHEQCVRPKNVCSLLAMERSEIVRANGTSYFHQAVREAYAHQIRTTARMLDGFATFPIHKFTCVEQWGSTACSMEMTSDTVPYLTKPLTQFSAASELKTPTQQQDCQ